VPTDLDPGETQAIGLALELHADLLLIDERKATAAARALGIPTIGVLLEAKRAGKIPSLLPLINQLETQLRFFVTLALKNALAQLAGA
jgi:predicted nucleic acid-binding protein